MAFLKPEDNGGLMEIGGQTGEGGNEGAMIVYDIVEDNKRFNFTIFT